MASVIASGVRKGNIIDIDGRLYVVLTAENFHPGKGTPTTQIEMRRISDGVKINERYKTTDQLEKAFVEYKDHNFLYQEGEHFIFMELVRPCHVTPGCNEQVPVIVGILVHHYHTQRAPVQYEPLFVGMSVPLGTEDTVSFPFPHNIFDAPGSPQILLHAITPIMERSLPGYALQYEESPKIGKYSPAP